MNTQSKSNLLPHVCSMFVPCINVHTRTDWCVTSFPADIRLNDNICSLDLSINQLEMFVQTCWMMNGMISLKFSGWGWVPYTNRDIRNGIQWGSYTKCSWTATLLTNKYEPWWACPPLCARSWPRASLQPLSLCLVRWRHRGNWGHLSADWCNRTDRGLSGLPEEENDDCNTVQEHGSPSDFLLAMTHSAG